MIVQHGNFRFYITAGCATSFGTGCDLGILMKNTVPDSEVRSTVIEPS
jgi:hypothetical protein